MNNRSEDVTGDDRQRILLVEDDESLGYVIRDNLSLKDFDITWCRDGEDGHKTFLSNRFCLCILDVMLPKKDGFTLSREIRTINQHVPIIFLTARSMTEDKLEGFKSGADDYIAKPFSIEELTCRINVFLRRTGVQVADQHEHQIGTYKFNSADFSLCHPKGNISLTSKEARVLELFCENQNRILKREEILKSIWGDDDYFMGRSLDVFISKLRKYLKEDKSVQIVNYHGIGFRLEIDSN